MIKTRIDKLLDTWKDTKDPDPEWSGAAYDYFKSQKEDLEKDLEVLEILLRKKIDIDVLIYIVKHEESFKRAYNVTSAFDYYNYSKALNGGYLTQEEFDKLADWLKRNDIIRSENNGSN